MDRVKTSEQFFEGFLKKGLRGVGGGRWERTVDPFFLDPKILLMFNLSFLSLIKKREIDRVKQSEQFFESFLKNEPDGVDGWGMGTEQ